jgi:hypothetical protein
MRLEKICPEPSRGRGWASVKFNKSTDLVDIESMAIVRPRHNESYLGKKGWQISEVRMPLNIQSTSGEELTLLLSPSIVQHLDVNQNLEFIFFDSKVQRASSTIVRWYGISYRAPGGEISPIEVIQADEIQSHDEVLALASKDHATAVDSTEYTQPESLLTWQPAPDIESSLDEVHVDLGVAKDPKLDLAKPFAPMPSLVHRMRCNNLQCSHEILSSMKICPFCAKKQ